MGIIATLCHTFIKGSLISLWASIQDYSDSKPAKLLAFLRKKFCLPQHKCRHGDHHSITSHDFSRHFGGVHLKFETQQSFHFFVKKFEIILHTSAN